MQAGAVPAVTPELLREVELHLWLRRLCDLREQAVAATGAGQIDSPA